METNINLNIKYGSGGSSSAQWGNITGVLSAQTDLQTALNEKANQYDVNNLYSGIDGLLQTTSKLQIYEAELAEAKDDISKLKTNVSANTSTLLEISGNCNSNYWLITSVSTELDKIRYMDDDSSSIVPAVKQNQTDITTLKTDIAGVNDKIIELNTLL